VKIDDILPMQNPVQSSV